MKVTAKLLSKESGGKGLSTNRLNLARLFFFIVLASVSPWPGSALAAVDQIQGACPATLLGGRLNCTTTSVKLAQVTVLEINGKPVGANPSCVAGSTIDVVVELGLEGAGNSDAFDLGVFLALDGLDATVPAASGGSQSCDVQTLEDVPSPLTQFDPVPDICGDFDSPGGNTVLNFNTELQSISLPCAPGPTGKLSFPFVVTWFNSGNNPVCRGAGDVGAGTRSLCSADSSFEVDVDVFGGITISKQTDPGGDPADFSFTTSGGLNPAAFSLADGDSQSLSTINPLSDIASTFTITEAALLPEWEFTSIECTGGASISVGQASQSVDIDLTIDNPTADCIFNNRKLASLTVVKNTAGGNDNFQFSGNNEIGAFSIDTTTLNTGSITFDNLPPAADYNIIESLAATPGWELASANCSNLSGTLVPDADEPALTEISLASGEQVTCTFNNVKQGTVNIIKETVSGDGSFDFTTDLPGGNFSLATAGGASPPASFANFSPGAYSVTETIPSGWTLTDLACTDPDGGTSWDVTTGIVQLDVDAGETVNCVYENTKQAELIIEKQTLPDGDPTSFTFSGDLAGSLTDGQQLSLLTDPRVASVSEAVPAGWELTTIACSGQVNSTILFGVDGVTHPGAFVPGDNSVEVDLIAGEEVTCVYTNTSEVSITVVKHITATGPASQSFEFASHTFPAPDDSFFLNPVDEATDDERTISGLTQGVYDVRELNNTNSGWQLINSVCSDGSPVNAINLAPGEHVTCTFTNAPIGSATIVKNSMGGDGLFEFTWGTVANPSIPENNIDVFNLLTTNAAQSDDFTFELLIDQPYDLTETDLPGPVGSFAKTWNLTDITCADPTGDSIFNPGQNGSDATVVADSAETVTCTFINTLEGTLLIRKQTIPDQSDQDFTFTGSHPDLAGTLNDFDIAAAELSRTALPEPMESTETVPAGWALTDISCTGAINSTVSIGGTAEFVTGDTGVAVNLAAGETVICTYTNTRLGGISIIKDAVGGDGAFSFNHTVPGDASPFVIDTVFSDTHVLSTALLPGTYNVSEVVPEGWDLTGIACSGATDSSITIGGANGFDPGDTAVTIDLLSGEDIACTFTNSKHASLTLVKTVTTDHGGTAVATDWTLNAAGPTPLSGVSGAPEVTDVIVQPGDYILSETNGPADYTAGSWSCSAGTLVDATVTIAAGDVATCTINNDDDPASLTLVKTVSNDNGGGALVTDWTLSATGPSNISGASGDLSITAAPVSSGVYTLAETNGPEGYVAGDWSCTAGALAGDQLTLTLGESTICTINNDDVAPGLTLHKTVVNDNGGTAVNTDWILSADGPTPISGVDGDASITAAAVDAGVYTLSESVGPTGYTAGSWSCEGGSLDNDQLTLGSGESAVCTINNDDETAVLTLQKIVNNDNGGTAINTDWTLSADGPTPISGVDGDASITAAAVDAGVYTLSESAGPDGYTASDWSCLGGSLIGDQLTLGTGESASCTINNDDNFQGTEPVAIPTNNTLALFLLTLMMLASGWYFRLAGLRRR